MKIVKLKHVTKAPTVEQYNALIDVINALNERVFLTEKQLTEITSKAIDINFLAREVSAISSRRA